MTLKKLQELFNRIVTQGLSVQYILCRLEDVQKSIVSMLKRSPKHVCNEVGDSPQDYTYPYSEMHGVLDKVQKEKLKKAMEAPIKDPSDAIRKAGW